MKDIPPVIAGRYFDRNFNCAQSVLAAFAARFGLDEAVALKVAEPFGGGLARRGETCGAVTGALMALGLARGTVTPESKEQVYHLAQEFMRRFEDQRGSILCRDLLGYDLSQPDGLEKARLSGATRTVCPNVVREAAELLQDMLEQD